MRAPAATPTTETDPERRWLAEVYRPGARQLTVRAVRTGHAMRTAA